MSRDQKPIIVKRVKRVEGGHHGGAWKVAYADFVTAMMAFFLLMWLLSSTTEDQRKGIADYFSPNFALPATTTGGDGPFGGRSMFSDDTLAHDATTPPKGQAEESSTDQAFWELEDELLGGSGDAAEADPLLRHIRTRVTDEGLIIEIFDIEGSPLFDQDTDEPLPVLERLVATIGRVIDRAANPVAVTGHLGAPAAKGDPWLSSAARAQSVRRSLVAAGVAEARLARVTGKADREPVVEDRADPRNRRVEITLLRRFTPETTH
jgi:chemotaxis protein MotB